MSWAEHTEVGGSLGLGGPPRLGWRGRLAFLAIGGGLVGALIASGAGSNETSQSLNDGLTHAVQIDGFKGIGDEVRVNDHQERVTLSLGECSLNGVTLTYQPEAEGNNTYDVTSYRFRDSLNAPVLNFTGASDLRNQVHGNPCVMLR